MTTTPMMMMMKLGRRSESKISRLSTKKNTAVSQRDWKSSSDWKRKRIDSRKGIQR
jgi:hypothetical protein